MSKYLFTVLNVLKVCRIAVQTLIQQWTLKWNSVPISSSTAGDNSAEAAAATRRRRGECPGPEPPRSRSRDQCRCCLSSRDNCHWPVRSPFVISPSLPQKRELKIYLFIGTNQLVKYFYGYHIQSQVQYISSIVNSNFYFIKCIEIRPLCNQLSLLHTFQKLPKPDFYV